MEEPGNAGNKELSCDAPSPLQSFLFFYSSSLLPFILFTKNSATMDSGNAQPASFSLSPTLVRTSANHIQSSLSVSLSLFYSLRFNAAYSPLQLLRSAWTCRPRGCSLDILLLVFAVAVASGCVIVDCRL